MLERLSLGQLRFALATSMEATRDVLKLLYPLLRRMQPHRGGPRLAALLEEEAGIEEPIFALSWVLTWFAHDITDLRQVARLFDLFLAIGHPLAPLYFSAALLEHRAPEIHALDEPDFPSCHQLLRNVPQDLPLGKLAKRTVELMEDHATWPPALQVRAGALVCIRPYIAIETLDIQCFYWIVDRPTAAAGWHVLCGWNVAVPLDGGS